jgi:hypothetical protein
MQLYFIYQALVPWQWLAWEVKTLCAYCDGPDLSAVNGQLDKTLPKVV